MGWSSLADGPSSVQAHVGSTPLEGLGNGRFGHLKKTCASLHRDLVTCLFIHSPANLTQNYPDQLAYLSPASMAAQIEGVVVARGALADQAHGLIFNIFIVFFLRYA